MTSSLLSFLFQIQNWSVKLRGLPVPCASLFETFLLSSSYSTFLPHSVNVVRFFFFLHRCPLVPCCLTFPVFFCPHEFSNSCFTCKNCPLPSILFMIFHLVQLTFIFHCCLPVFHVSSYLLLFPSFKNYFPICCLLRGVSGGGGGGESTCKNIIIIVLSTNFLLYYYYRNWLLLIFSL